MPNDEHEAFLEYMEVLSGGDEPDEPEEPTED